MTIDKYTEDQLDQFLKSNQPEAPAPKGNEYQRILSSITSIHEKQQTRLKTKTFFNNFTNSLKWFVPIAATAALVLFIWNHKTPQINGTITNEQLASYVDDSFENVYVYEEEDSYSEVGGDFFDLADAIIEQEG